MFSRNLARAATAATAAAPRTTIPLRVFSSTSASASKITPALADIHPEGHEDFNAKQKAFREKLIEDQRQAEARASPPHHCPPSAFLMTP